MHIDEWTSHKLTHANKRVMKFQHPQFPGRHVHSADMRELLGLDRKAKLPAEGMPARYLRLTECYGGTQNLMGVKVWVNPLVGERGRAAKRSTHRVMCACPFCGSEMSAGRLFQHICKSRVTA